MKYVMSCWVQHDPEALSTFCSAKVDRIEVTTDGFETTEMWARRVEFLWDEGHSISVASFLAASAQAFKQKAYPSDPF